MKRNLNKYIQEIRKDMRTLNEYQKTLGKQRDTPICTRKGK